jgi:hypothetical protein
MVVNAIGPGLVFSLVAQGLMPPDHNHAKDSK